MNTATGAAPIDWTAVTGSGLTLTGAILGVSGRIEQLTIAGVLTGTTDFAISEQTVAQGELLVGTLENLELQVGTAEVGVKVTGDSIRIALLANGAQRFTGIEASGLTITATLPGITGSIINGGVRVNTATGAPALDWTTVTESGLSLTGAIVGVTGEITGLDLFGVFAGGVAVAFESRTVDVPALSLVGASLMTITISLDGPTRFLNMGSIVEIADGTLTLAMLTPAGTADARRWRAVQAVGLSANIDIFGAIAITGVGVNYNAAVGATALDWTTIAGSGITLTDGRKSVSGTVTVTDLFGLVTGTITFELASEIVDVVTPALTGAELTTISVTLGDVKIGQATGVHFSADGGSLVLARLSHPTDPRTFTALIASIEGAALEGIDGLTLSADDISVSINQGGLNWATALGRPVVVGTTTIELSGERFSASGRATLDVFGLLTGSARFALDQRTVDVDLDGDPATAGDQLDDAQLTAFALTEIDLKLGTDTVGLRIGPGGSIGVASLAKTGDPRSWVAVTASNLSISLTIPGIAGSVVNGGIAINRATGATPLNWAAADGTPLTVDLNAADGFTTPTALVEAGGDHLHAARQPVRGQGQPHRARPLRPDHGRGRLRGVQDRGRRADRCRGPRQRRPADLRALQPHRRRRRRRLRLRRPRRHDRHRCADRAGRHALVGRGQCQGHRDRALCPGRHRARDQRRPADQPGLGRRDRAGLDDERRHRRRRRLRRRRPRRPGRRAADAGRPHDHRTASSCSRSPAGSTTSTCSA